MRISVDDVRRFHCVHGIRSWFQRHDLDFRAFVKDGIEADTLLATGDLRARQVVEAKRQRMEGDAR